MIYRIRFHPLVARDLDAIAQWIIDYAGPDAAARKLAEIHAAIATLTQAAHPQRHLAGFSGILQADAYSGFKALYTPDTSGKSRIREAACWAHLRRDFFDVHTATKSEIAREVLDRIGDLYDIERQISGQSRDARRAIRQIETRPKVEAFKAWSEVQLTRIPGKSDLAKAFRSALNRWTAFTHRSYRAGFTSWIQHGICAT